MGWTIKCCSDSRWRKHTRAILGKYGTRISPSIYTISNKSILNSCLDEIKWCVQRGISLKVSVVRLSDCDFFIGSGLDEARRLMIDKACTEV